MQHLDGVLAPQLGRIRDSLSLAARAAPGGKDGDVVGAELAASVGAMANLSKGFKVAVASEVEARFFQVGTV